MQENIISCTKHSQGHVASYTFCYTSKGNVFLLFPAINALSDIFIFLLKSCFNTKNLLVKNSMIS